MKRCTLQGGGRRPTEEIGQLLPHFLRSQFAFGIEFHDISQLKASKFKKRGAIPIQSPSDNVERWGGK